MAAGANGGVKESIELALIDLMQAKAFSSISVKEITEHAHVSRMSFYRNFSSKEDVLGQFIDDRLPQLIMTKSGELADDDVRPYLERVLERIGRSAPFFNLLRANGLTHLLYGHFLKVGGEYIQRSQPRAVPYQDTYYTGGTLLVILEWINHGMPETPAELARIIDTLYYRRNF